MANYNEARARELVSQFPLFPDRTSHAWWQAAGFAAEAKYGSREMRPKGIIGYVTPHEVQSAMEYLQAIARKVFREKLAGSNHFICTIVTEN